MKLKTIRIIDFFLGNFLIVILRPVVILLGNVLHKDHSLKIRNNITILKILGGGSLVIAFPVLLGLRKKYPDLKINLLTKKGTSPFARTLNIFDTITEIDDSSLFRLIYSSLNAYRKTLLSDTIIDLEAHSRLSTVFSLLTCARNRIGFYLEEAFWRKRINTHLVFFNRFSGSYYFYDKIFQLYSIYPASADDCKEHLLQFLPDAEKPDKYRICIGHACSDLGTERMLNAKQWESVFLSRIDKSLETEVLFLGGKNDAKLASEIIETLLPHFKNIKFTNLCGKTTLNESLSILSASKEFWGIDSSLLHYTRLSKIKTVSYWGPTDPQTRLRHIPGLQEEVFYSKIPCSPCIHVTETPPCLGDNICIQNLFNEKKRDWIGLLT